jgi:signal transduction histidine kinase
MIRTYSQNGTLTWFSRSPWRILASGLVLALALAGFLMWQLMEAPMSEITTLVSTLALTSVISLGVGYWLYRRGWVRSPSLLLTLLASYVWAAVLTVFNVWVMSVQMFVSEHDLTLSIVLLLFAAIIATTFGVFAAASITDGLRQLDQTAKALAGGELGARTAVSGQDEVARVAHSFNEMAAQLQTAEHERAKLDALRREFIAWTSHDLRTPLTSIRAMVEALHDGLVDDPEMARRYYRTIRSDVMAMNKLIDDFFELAQLETDGLVLELSYHSLPDLVSDLLESFQALARQRNITLIGEVRSDIDLVSFNAEKMSRVLANLLSNALRYTPDGGSVQLRAMRTAEGIEVTVCDTGPGFSDKDLERIFEKFYRGEQARSRATGGAGLGLAIAAGIVAAHNGRIWATNRAEGGACVGFVLPTTK